MNNEEIEKVLDELQQVRPEVLNKEAKRLFNAIMSIADERDSYLQRIKAVIEYIDKIDNRTFIEHEELEYIKNILKGGNK